MPVARFQLEDGRIARFEVADGTSPEDANAAFEEFFAQQQAEARGTFQERPTGEKALGVLGAGAQLVSSALAEPVAGLAGLGASILPGDPGAGARAVESTREALTIDAGEAGRQFLQESISGIAEKGKQIFGGENAPLLDLATGAIDLQTQLAQQAAEAGNPGLATAIKTLPTAALEAVPAALGIRAAGRATGITPTPKTPDIITPQSVGIDEVSQAISDTGKAAKEIIPQRKSKQEIARLIKDDIADDSTATFELIPQRDPKKKPRVQTDKEAAEVVRQGFSEGSIRSLKASTTDTKRNAGKMFDIAEKIKRNESFGMTNRPSDVLGDSLFQRINVVRASNKRAGKSIEPEVKKLKGKPIDISQPAEDFINGMEDIGVRVTLDGKLDFKGSDIEGAIGAENVIKKVFDRMSNPAALDGKEVHRLKNFIDEQVTHGKNLEGLAGVAERKLKDLRFDLKETLNETFPAYGRANLAYSDTIDVLDAIQDLAGKKMDLTGEHAGTGLGGLMRRVAGNAQSRSRLLGVLDEIERVVDKHGDFTSQKLIGKGKKTVFNDELLTQVMLANQLDRVVGIAPATSLQGSFDASIARGAALAAATGTGGLGVAIDAGIKVAKKASNRPITDKAALKAGKALIRKELAKDAAKARKL